MDNTELLKQIDKIQKLLTKKGIVTDKLIEELKALREIFINGEEKLPRVVKILRFTYEHIGNYETFSIAIPEDKDEEEDDVDGEAEPGLSVDELRVESLSYLVSLFEKPTQKLNAEDLNYYMGAFVTYAKEN